MSEDLIKDINDELDEIQSERSEGEYPWVLFAIEGTAYGMNSKYVLSIEILDEVTPIVDSPHYCPGITEFRNDMISLVDLRALFNIGTYRDSDKKSSASYQTDDRSMTVVTEVDGHVRGIIVDEIISVEYITNFVESMTVGGNSLQSEYLRSIAKRERENSTVLILDEEKLSRL